MPSGVRGMFIECGVCNELFYQTQLANHKCHNHIPYLKAIVHAKIAMEEDIQTHGPEGLEDKYVETEDIYNMLDNLFDEYVRENPIKST